MFKLKLKLHQLSSLDMLGIRLLAILLLECGSSCLIIHGVMTCKKEHVCSICKNLQSKHHLMHRLDMTKSLFQKLNPQIMSNFAQTQNLKLTSDLGLQHLLEFLETRLALIPSFTPQKYYWILTASLGRENRSQWKQTLAYLRLKSIITRRVHAV